MTEDELQKHIEPFYPLVGRIVVDWAMVERELDGAAAIFKTIDLSGDGKLPLRDRVEQLRSAFRNLTDDSEERAFMDRLADEILGVADIRDVIAQGIWSSFREGPPFALTFAAPLGCNDGQPAELTASAADLENLLEKMAKLRSELVVFPFV